MLSVNIFQTEPESEAFLDGRFEILLSGKKATLSHRGHPDFHDPEAFTIFTLILTSLFSAPMEIFNVLQSPHFTHVPSVQ